MVYHLAHFEDLVGKAGDSAVLGVSMRFGTEVGVGVRNGLDLVLTESEELNQVGSDSLVTVVSAVGNLVVGNMEKQGHDSGNGASIAVERVGCIADLGGEVGWQCFDTHTGR